MTTPPLATLEHFSARYVRPLRTEEYARVTALLADASALVRDIAGTDFLDAGGDLVDDLPGIVVVTTFEIARRAFDNPAGLNSETVGAHTWAIHVQGGSGLFVTEREATAIRRALGRSGVGSVELVHDGFRGGAGLVPSADGGDPVEMGD